MSDFGICLDPAFQENQESLTCDLPKQNSQESANVCEPKPKTINKDHFVAYRSMLDERFSEILSKEFSSKYCPDPLFLKATSLIYASLSIPAYNPFKFFNDCNKKGFFEKKMAQILIEHPEQYLNVAQIYASQGHYRKAEKLFKLGLAKNPNSFITLIALGGLGAINLSEGKIHNLDEIFKKARELDFDSGECIFSYPCLKDLEGRESPFTSYIRILNRTSYPSGEKPTYETKMQINAEIAIEIAARHLYEEKYVEAEEKLNEILKMNKFYKNETGEDLIKQATLENVKNFLAYIVAKKEYLKSSE